MIKKINYIKASRFVRSYGKGASVSVSEKGSFFGFFKDSEMVGLIGTQSMGDYIRIKSFLVMKIYRGQGIGSELLDFVFYDNLQYTAYATEDSIELFKRKNFKVTENSKNRKIKYLKYVQ